MTAITLLMRLALILTVAWASVGRDSVAAASDAVPIGASMHRGGTARTGEFPGPAPQSTPVVQWQTWLGLLTSSSPVVSDEVVYIGSVSPLTREGGALHAVDADSGEELWRWRGAEGDGVFSTPAVEDGMVFVGTYDGVVAALSAQDGEEHWRFQAESAVFGSPAVVDGVLYVGDVAGFIYALSVATGQELWRFALDTPYDRSVGATLAVVDGTVFGTMAARRETLDALTVALDANTGEERWRFAATYGETVWGIPVVANGSVFVQTAEGSVFRLDATTGEAIWQFVMSAPFFLESLAYADGVVYAADSNGLLVAIDALLGQDRWGVQFEIGVPLSVSPAVADGTLLIGDADGYLYGLNADSGAALWGIYVNSFYSSPAIVDGVIYIGSDDGTLYSLREEKTI